MATKEWHRLHPEKQAEYSQRTREKHPDTYHFAQLSYTYQIDGREVYTRLFQLQQGKCALCGATEPGRGKKFFCLDHDHKTNAVRGLLCFDCNSGLGNFKDNVEVLAKAILYLRN